MRRYNSFHQSTKVFNRQAHNHCAFNQLSICWWTPFQFNIIFSLNSEVLPTPIAASFRLSTKKSPCCFAFPKRDIFSSSNRVWCFPIFLDHHDGAASVKSSKLAIFYSWLQLNTGQGEPCFFGFEVRLLRSQVIVAFVFFELEKWVPINAGNSPAIGRKAGVNAELGPLGGNK